MHQSSKIRKKPKTTIWQKNTATTWSTRSIWKSSKFLSTAHLLKKTFQLAQPTTFIDFSVLYRIKYGHMYMCKKTTKSSLFSQRRHFSWQSCTSWLYYLKSTFLNCILWICWKYLKCHIMFSWDDQHRFMIKCK